LISFLLEGVAVHARIAVLRVAGVGFEGLARISDAFAWVEPFASVAIVNEIARLRAELQGS
jgi:hypothetical protein